MKIKEGKAWSGPHFQMRQNIRNLLFDSSGFWSYPALIIRDDGRVDWLHLVLTVDSTESEHSLTLYRPHAIAITLQSSSMMIEYSDLSFCKDPFAGESWDKPIAKYPWKEMRYITPKQMKDEESLLMLSYENAASEFLKNKTLPKDFSSTFLKINHPIFMKYLRIVASDFVNALTPFKKTSK